MGAPSSIQESLKDRIYSAACSSASADLILRSMPPVAPFEPQKVDPQRTIFCFWHPWYEVPGYLRLCQQTWRKFYPEFTIVELDRLNIEKWLPPGSLPWHLGLFSLLAQADYIRAQLLALYGGYWLDHDSIITKRNFFFETRKDNAFHAIGGRRRCHIGVLYADRSIIASEWALGVREKITLLQTMQNLSRQTELPETVRMDIAGIQNTIFQEWDVLGNSVLNPLLVKYPDNYRRFSSRKHGALLERVETSIENSELQEPRDIYRHYYFSNCFDPSILSKTDGLILLHNSWTPAKYKNMQEADFLREPICLASLLRHVLGIKTPVALANTSASFPQSPARTDTKRFPNRIQKRIVKVLTPFIRMFAPIEACIKLELAPEDFFASSKAPLRWVGKLLACFGPSPQTSFFSTSKLRAAIKEWKRRMHEHP